MLSSLVRFEKKTMSPYQIDNIPPKLIRENEDICSFVVSSDVNRCIETGKFRDNFKKKLI